MKKRFFILILVGWFGNTIAQNSLIDSLKNEIQNGKEDTTHVKHLLELSNEQFYYSLTESLIQAEKAKELSIKIGYTRGVAKADFCAGYALLELGKTEEALEAGIRATKYFQDNRDSSGIASINNLTGMSYLRLGNTEMALSKLVEATQISEKLNNPLTAASSYNNLAEVYSYSNDRINAKKYYLKSEEYLKLTNDKYRMAIVLMNIANATDSIEEKISFLNRSIKIGEENSYHQSLGYSYAALGDVYMYTLQDYEESIHVYHKGLLNARISGDYRMQAHSSTHIGASWLELNQPDSANKYLEQVGTEYLEDNYLREFLYYKAKTKHKTGLYSEGFQLLDSTLSMHITHFNQELAEKTSEANAKFETEKKEKEIVQQQLLITRQKNNRNFIIITGAILLGIIALFAQYFIGRHKRQQKLAEMALGLEQQRANDLEELSKTKTNLFNNISHELRTPLTMIIGPLEEASKKVKNLHLKSEIDLALQNSNRLTGLVNEILDLSKLDSGKLTIEKNKIQLYAFTKRVIHAFSSLAASQLIVLKDNLDQEKLGDITFESDIQNLEKILNNLIANAIKYSESGGTVYFKIDYEQLDKNQLNISIIDEGIGISVEDQGKIFDRYYQASQANHISGTGIGLALTKELCELLGGSVWVKSEPGKGSCFTFDIPIVKSTIPPASGLTEIPVTSEKTDIMPILLKGRRPEILIVEDDLQMAKYLHSLLSPNYDCMIAHNGQQAIELLNKKSFDLISSDVMMPEMDGFEFRQKINQDSRLKNTPFILLTARVLEEDKLKGFQLGIDDYITKPFSASELKARIRNLIKNKVSRLDTLTEVEISHDGNLLENAKNLVIENLDNPKFKVEQLASALNYSSRQLGRVLKKTTGLTPVEFILELRLQNAFRIIKDRKFSTLNEVRYEVGIESASYFTTKFKERFGLNPSEVD